MRYFAYLFIRISFISLSILPFSQKAFSQQKPISADTRARILAAFRFMNDSLLHQAPEPYVFSTAPYSEAAFEEVRRQIWMGNLQESRAYLLQAMSSEDLKNQGNLYVTARSVWVDYLITVDSIELAYVNSVHLLELADKLNVSNKSLAHIAAGKAGATLEEHYSNAATNAEAALQIALATKDKAMEAKAHLIIGVLARGLFWGTSGRSLPHYEKALAAGAKGKDTATLIRALVLKHSDIAQPGDVNGGFPSLEQAIHLCAQSRYLKFVPNLCVGLYIDLAAIGENDKGTAMLLAALRYAKKFNMRQQELHDYIQLSEFYQERKMYDSAIYYLEQWKVPDMLDPGRKPLMLVKANLFYEIGRFKEAATMYHDNLRDHENAYMLHGQNVLSRWETTMRMQDKEQEIKAGAVKSRTLTWISSAIAAVLTITLLAFFWQRSLRKRLAAQNRVISGQSKTLEQSLSEKELLLREIHHRVKNNLQVIESLLDMHQDNASSIEQQEGFSKARAHIHTIAIIHQNLYQQDNLSSVCMRTFTNELFLQTQSPFNQNKESIVFDNDIAEVQLDIDTAVPLGLILNELFTNAFKYVLPQKEVMRLFIDIKQESGSERYVMQCCDNGPGLPIGFIFKKDGSLGMELIQQLSRQIGGKISYDFKDGSCFTVTFLSLKGRKESD